MKLLCSVGAFVRVNRGRDDSKLVLGEIEVTCPNRVSRRHPGWRRGPPEHSVHLHSLDLETSFTALLVHGRDMDLSVQKYALWGTVRPTHDDAMVWLWFEWAVPPRSMDGYNEAMTQGISEDMMDAAANNAGLAV